MCWKDIIWHPHIIKNISMDENRGGTLLCNVSGSRQKFFLALIFLWLCELTKSYKYGLHNAASLTFYTLYNRHWLNYLVLKMVPVEFGLIIQSSWEDLRRCCFVQIPIESNSSPSGRPAARTCDGSDWTEPLFYRIQSVIHSLLNTLQNNYKTDTLPKNTAAVSRQAEDKRERLMPMTEVKLVDLPHITPVTGRQHKTRFNVYLISPQG